MSLFLRAPVLEDYAQIAAWVRTAEECLRWAGPKMPYPFASSDLFHSIASAPAVVVGEVRQHFVICKTAGAVEGYGELVRVDATTFRLARIIVAPTSRGRGVAVELCGRLIAKARAAPEAQRIGLYVYRHNQPAIKLYSKLGFVEEPAAERPEIMAMEKRLR